MTEASNSRHPMLGLFYDIVLGIASGFAVGFFGWLAADRLTDTTQALWPYLAGGIVLVFLLLRWARPRRRVRNWMHLLWIPVVLFLGLLALIILALRSFT